MHNLSHTWHTADTWKMSSSKIPILPRRMSCLLSTEYDFHDYEPHKHLPRGLKYNMFKCMCVCACVCARGEGEGELLTPWGQGSVWEENTNTWIGSPALPWPSGRRVTELEPQFPNLSNEDIHYYPACIRWMLILHDT